MRLRRDDLAGIVTGSNSQLREPHNPGQSGVKMASKDDVGFPFSVIRDVCYCVFSERTEQGSKSGCRFISNSTPSQHLYR